MNLIPGGASLEQASAQDIANELGGVLPASFLQQLQTSAAQQGAAGGFGVDSPNLNASALRAMGQTQQQLNTQGQSDLLAQAQLGEQQSSAQAQEAQAAQNESDTRAQYAAQNALEAAAQANAQQEWQAQLAEKASEAGAALAEQQSEFGQTLQENKDALAQQMGLSYSQLNEQQAEFVNSQAQQLQEQQNSLAEQAREANQANALAIAQMNAQMEQANQQYQLALSSQPGQLALQNAAQQQAYQEFLYQTPPWTYTAPTLPIRNMPYAPAIPQYTPMAPFKPTPFTPAESSDQFLASTTAAMQPALSAQQGTYQQALALQQQELALAKKAQADALSNYYYSTPPWSARAAQSPVAAPAAMQAEAAPKSRSQCRSQVKATCRKPYKFRRAQVPSLVLAGLLLSGTGSCRPRRYYNWFRT